MTFKLLSIINKNFLLLLHSKLSSLILIFGPILLVLILGLGLGNSGLKDIQTSIYISEHSTFTENFVDNLKLRGFIISESNSLENCINEVKNSNKNLCIELRKSEISLPSEIQVDKNSSADLGLGYEVQLYVDFSKQRIVWGIISAVDKSVSDFSSGLRTELSNGLKLSLEDYAEEIGEIILDINLAITSMNSIEQTMNTLQGDLTSSRNNINVINDLIIQIDSDILYLQNTVPGLLDTSLYLNFQNLKSNWESANLNGMISNMNNQISNSKNSLINMKNTLIQTKSDLYETQDKIKSIGEINMNYILYPIPLIYDSISDDLSGQVKTQFSFFDYIFPSFLSFFILLVSIILATSFTIKERTSHAYLRNTLSKAFGPTFLAGNFITIFIIVFLQCTMILSIAYFFLTFNLLNYILSLSLLLLFSISLFIIIGMIIGYLFNSQETAMIAGISLTLLLIVFSPLISPLETLPNFLRTFFSYTPIVLTEDILRRVLIFESSFLNNISKFIALGISSIILSGILIGSYYLKKYQEIN